MKSRRDKMRGAKNGKRLKAPTSGSDIVAGPPPPPGPGSKQPDHYEIVAELNKVQEHLRIAHASLEQCARDACSVEERATREERCRLAQMLHDGLQQVLVAAKMRLHTAVHSPPSPATKAAGEQALALLGEAIHVSRTLTLDLSPLHFADEGLGPALIWLSNWFAANHNLKVTMDVAPDAEPQSDLLRTVVFQGVREILFNAVKHAGIDNARVRVVRGKSDLQVVVEDQGVGFQPQWFESNTDGFGLFSVKRRLEALGGTMEVVSAPGAGTRVTLKAPLASTGGDWVSNAKR